MAEIRLDGVRHRYGRSDDALKGIDLTWEDGGAYALLGPSGCGKTTMLNIISGLLTPTEGRILFDGVDVTGASTVERNIAQVFQFPVLYESMTVEQNMRFPLRNRGIDKREAQARAEEVAELLEIGHLLKERAKGLSADAKQLVSLSRALVRRDVSAILFDEPLTVIDPQKKWTLRQALKRVHSELNHTLVYVTHDQTEALTFADTVVVMDQGEVVQKGTPDELFERPAHTFVGNFIGSPGMNFIDCAVRGGVVGFGGVDLLRLPSSVSPDHEPGDVIGIRPDFVRCAPLDRSGPAGLEAEVGAVRDIGTAHLVELLVGDAGLVARIPPGEHVPSGRCTVLMDGDDVHFFRHGVRVEGSSSVVGTGGAR
ncbi:MAG: ABC transporter ATP-binding protein [Acidimicrobiia bacterium]|nr:ABC transporter ATP-binding protein [Acidimicrobiia bacterium]